MLRYFWTATQKDRIRDTCTEYNLPSKVMNKDKIEGIDTDELFLHKPLFNNVTIFGKEV